MFLPLLSTIEGALDCCCCCGGGRLGLAGVVMRFTADAVLCAGAATN